MSKYLLPNGITSLNLMLGAAAIIIALQHESGIPVCLILLCGLLDIIDGRIARKLALSSDFGRYFDSMADMVAFGVASGVVARLFLLNDMGAYGTAAVVIYILCAGIRLARFNAHGNNRYFVGLPVPAAGAVIALMVAIKHIPAYICLFVILLLSLLMVSNIRVPSFK
jgi:CDP-diacylglycerol--serine O-phosphatidyltransferase